MKKVTVICGTRPEGVKLYPLLAAMEREVWLETHLLISGQHPDPARELLSSLERIQRRELALLPTGGGLNMNFLFLFEGISRVLASERPDAVVVHGDTQTAFSGALSAFQLGIPVCHVEAGLRTYDFGAPFPEEYYRVSIDACASLLLAPTLDAREALLREGRKEERIFVTGNTVVDMLRLTEDADTSKTVSYTEEEKKAIAFASAEAPVCLLSLHRREHAVDADGILRAIARVMTAFPMLRILYMVYPTPNGRRTAELLSSCENVMLHPPLSVYAYHALLRQATMIVTDSGGVQEEAAALHIPTFVLRDRTERGEGLRAGGIRLIGTKEDAVVTALTEALNDPAILATMKHAENPYGDGHASEKIIIHMKAFLNGKKTVKSKALFTY